MDAELSNMYERVLHPTDGSEAADVAAEHALAVARRFDAPLHLLYVVDTTAFHGADAFSDPPLNPPLDALEAEGQAQIDQITERGEREGVEVTSEVVEGRPASAIVGEAEDGDVVVMGTHGRTGLDRYLIGSTTEKVVRTAEVPVVTVPVPEADGADETDER